MNKSSLTTSFGKTRYKGALKCIEVNFGSSPQTVTNRAPNPSQTVTDIALQIMSKYGLKIDTYVAESIDYYRRAGPGPKVKLD
jgi:hypothetical protein